RSRPHARDTPGAARNTHSSRPAGMPSGRPPRRPHPGGGGRSHHSDGVAEEPDCLSALSAGSAPSPRPVRISRGVRPRHGPLIFSAPLLVEEVPQLESPNSPTGAEGSPVSGAARRPGGSHPEHDPL